jgi:hypothetical protein
MYKMYSKNDAFWFMAMDLHVCQDLYESRDEIRARAVGYLPRGNII